MPKSNQEDTLLLEGEKNLDAFTLLCNWGVRQETPFTPYGFLGVRQS